MHIQTSIFFIGHENYNDSSQPKVVIPSRVTEGLREGSIQKNL